MGIRRHRVLIALRKEYQRHGVRMCRILEHYGCVTKLVADAPALLTAEMEFMPEVIVLDSTLSQPHTTDLVQNLQDRPGDAKAKLILLDIPVGEEKKIRERWPEVEIIV